MPIVSEVALDTGNRNRKNVRIVRQKKSTKKKSSPAEPNKLNEDSVPPDGGWGWMVAIGAGVSFLSTFPILQSFGILFRKHFTEFGWNSSQIVTLINAQQAASALIGIFSGPLYRKLTYRQVSFMGAILILLGLTATLFSTNYLEYFFSITFLYGFGKGLILSASVLAVNAYFSSKRRSAMNVMTTVAGVGPMFFPFLSTFLMVQYDVAGTVLFYTGFCLHNFLSALIFQPVSKHGKPLKGQRLAENLRILQIETPMTRLENNKSDYQDSNLKPNVDKNKRTVYNMIVKKDTSLQTSSPPEEVRFLQKPREDFIEDENPKNRSCLRKVIDYLHLDLLKDFTYFNLALGLTVIEFTENNFASVLPFILTEFGFSNVELAMCMSMLGSCDMIMKFLIPHTVAKMKCDKRVIMIFSCMLICGARVVVGQSRKVPIALVCFAVMGTNKAIRVAYGNMILPGYVAPKRLSDAIALERTIMGVFSLCAAPIIGLIPDATSYGFFVLFMNGMCVVVGLLWFGEDLIRCCIRKCRKTTPSEISGDKTVDI